MNDMEKSESSIRFSDEEIKMLITRSATLYDRLGTEFQVQEFFQTSDEHKAEYRLIEWKKISAKGDTEKFNNRLKWDGIDPESVKRLLGAVEFSDGFPVPEWVGLLDAVLSNPGFFSDQSDFTLPEDRCLDGQASVPFEELFLPFISEARKRLIKECGAGYHVLSDTAHIRLEKGLLNQLHGIAGNCLDVRFSIFRSRHKPVSVLLGRNSTVEPESKTYRAFIREMFRGGLKNFFFEYPVSARLTATAVVFWVAAQAEFLKRLMIDWTAIEETFQKELLSPTPEYPYQTGLGRVVDVHTDLSDPHRRGRTVVGIEFESGLKLIYKPRSVGLEKLYFDLLDWINRQSSNKYELLPFKVLTVLNQTTHGWMTWVEQRPCQDEQTASRFFIRYGYLLSLLHALTGEYSNCDNIIVSGEHPVLVDLELTVESGYQDMQDTSTETGRPEKRTDHAVREQDVLQELISGLLDGEDDPMIRGYFRDAEWVKTGMEAMYRFLIRHRSELLNENSPLSDLKKNQIRIRYRRTGFYRAVLKKALKSINLRDGIDFSMQLDRLSNSFLKTENGKPATWPLLKAEHQALSRLDIPYFATRTAGDDLVFGVEQAVAVPFAEPGCQFVMNRLKRLDKVDFSI